MWKKIDKFVKEQEMISAGDTILLGLSGGADSILLARYLLTLRDKGKIHLFALHVNHKIREGEADRDEAFVKHFCKQWEIPCVICRKDVSAYAKEHKMSLEEAGRTIRYLCLEENAHKMNCNKIALAHHAVDLVETMLFRMMRGTGTDGMAGILPIHENKIRPLLYVDKEEILGILSKLQQDYVEDSTNQETEYTRNYIRHRIIPAMYQVNEKVISHMTQLAKQVREEKEYLKILMDKKYDTHIIIEEKGVKMPMDYLKGCHAFETKEMIRRMLFQVAGCRKDISTIHVDMVWKLLHKTEGKHCILPYDMVAVREETMLYIGREMPENNNKSQCYEIPLEDREIFSLQISEGEYIFEKMSNHFPEDLKRDCVKYFDYDKIKGKLVLRTREEGDYFVMNAEGQTKKLNRYFIDEKIPLSKRDSLLLLAEGKHILWITGGRISEEYKVTKKTNRILRVTYRKRNNNVEVHYGR